MTQYTPKNILVTGGAGFIGTNFIHYWIKQYSDAQIVCLDALTYAGNKESLAAIMTSKNFHFCHGDILDHELVKRLMLKYKIDTVVHFAAESHVDRSIAGPDAFIQTNVVGTHNLLKVAKQIWLDGRRDPLPHRFHHVSTDEVYGSLELNDEPFTELTPYQPNSPYAASKAGSDHLVRAYHHTYGLNVTTSNCSNNYGPYQYPEKLIPVTIINSLEGRSIPVYGDGKNQRDWIYVDDHSRGVEMILRQGKVGETYNIGANNEWSNIDLVRMICTLLNEKFHDSPDLKRRFPDSPAVEGKSFDALVTYVTDRLGHDRRYSIDAEKIQTILGFRPHTSFKSGLGASITWYLENETWWRPVMEKSHATTQSKSAI